MEFVRISYSKGCLSSSKIVGDDEVFKLGGEVTQLRRIEKANELNSHLRDFVAKAIHD